MLSYCRVCGKPTDMALADVVTEEQATDFCGGYISLPLDEGTCGEIECIEKALFALAAEKIINYLL